MIRIARTWKVVSTPCEAAVERGERLRFRRGVKLSMISPNSDCFHSRYGLVKLVALMHDFHLGAVDTTVDL
jgi:hypothetical protein